MGGGGGVLAAADSRIGDVRASRLRHGAAVLAVGVLCYVAVAWSLNRVARSIAGEPRIAIVSHKLDYLRAHAGDYDVLLLGSSRFHYNLDPAMVDDGLGQAGCPARTFNLGVQGMTAAEESWFVDVLSDIPGRRWKVMVVERNQLPPRTIESIGSDRHRLGFHDLHQTWLSIQAMATADRGRLQAAIGIAHVAASYVYYQLEPGRIAELLFGRTTEPPSDGYTIDLSRDGFVPIETEVSPILKARAERMDWSEFATRLDGLRTEPPRPKPLSPTRRDMLLAQIDEAHHVAPEVVLALLPQAIRPMVDDNASIAEAARQGVLGSAKVLNLGDPLAYPQLFADGIWYDDDHVMGDGPARLSREFGRALCREVPALRKDGP